MDEDEIGVFRQTGFDLTGRVIDFFVKQRGAVLLAGALIAGAAFGGGALWYQALHGAAASAFDTTAGWTMVGAGSWATFPVTYQAYNRWLHHPEHPFRYAFARWLTLGHRVNHPPKHGMLGKLGMTVVVGLGAAIMLAGLHAAPLAVFVALGYLTYPPAFRFCQQAERYVEQKREQQDQIRQQQQTELSQQQLGVKGPGVETVRTPVRKTPSKSSPSAAKSTTRRTTAPAKKAVSKTVAKKAPAKKAPVKSAKAPAKDAPKKAVRRPALKSAKTL